MSQRATALLLFAYLIASACGAEEPIIGGPCEGCENVFVGLSANLSAQARIAPLDEPGEALVIEGTVRTQDGTPAAGIVIYAYHTDAGGEYPPAATRHGRLRGWVRTDEEGRYRFETIRPGAYPGRDIAQHVHMHVIEPGRATYYIDSVVFDDDPLLTPDKLRQHRRGRGGFGVSSPSRDSAGVWHVSRDIILRQAIPTAD